MCEAQDMTSLVVQVRREPVIFPTYAPEAPDKNPMFLEDAFTRAAAAASTRCHSRTAFRKSARMLSGMPFISKMNFSM